MLPTDHGGTRWSSLGRLYGATPTPKGIDPNGRLYQTGVGTIHPRQQTNALNQYINGCSNSTVACFVRDDNHTKRNSVGIIAGHNSTCNNFTYDGIIAVHKSTCNNSELLYGIIPCAIISRMTELLRDNSTCNNFTYDELLRGIIPRVISELLYGIIPHAIISSMTELLRDNSTCNNFTYDKLLRGIIPRA